MNPDQRSSSDAGDEGLARAEANVIRAILAECALVLAVSAV